MQYRLNRFVSIISFRVVPLVLIQVFLLVYSWRVHYSEYVKPRALFFHANGLSPLTIANALAKEGLVATRQGLAKFIKRYQETGSVWRRPGSGRLSKVTPVVRIAVKEQMQTDDKTTAVQLSALLQSKGYNLSLHNPS